MARGLNGPLSMQRRARWWSVSPTVTARLSNTELVNNADMSKGARHLLVPDSDRAACVRFVDQHFSDLVCDPDGAASPRFRGGQQAADAALVRFDVSGYAATRNDVSPEHRRGASALSPYIRHGLLPLRRVWDVVAGGPARDVAKFRDELLWQEYARHWYATLGSRTTTGMRRELPLSAATDGDGVTWDVSMSCLGDAATELYGSGWLVNQVRMWLSSDWAVRRGGQWQLGEDEFFAHLLDGSRAANRLGWQWTSGVGSSTPYGFSRWQVEKRSPGLCRQCAHADDCPIEDWPTDPTYVEVSAPALAKVELFGPDAPMRSGTPDAVWLTAESLGGDDPALAANPDLPVVFVFDEPLLQRLSLSKKRLVFLTETLADLAESRTLEIWRGRPEGVLSGRCVAVTHAPVPGFAARSSAIAPAEVHPWPWLCAPVRGASVRSFSAWRKKVDVPR